VLQLLLHDQSAQEMSNHYWRSRASSTRTSQVFDVVVHGMPVPVGSLIMTAELHRSHRLSGLLQPPRKISPAPAPMPSAVDQQNAAHAMRHRPQSIYL